jgi:hypothetical protein
VTLGALGGAVQPLTREELLALPPVINLPTLGQALGVSESVIRERARRGDLERMGIRVLRLGVQYRIPLADVLTVLGLDSDKATGGASPAPPVNAADPSPEGTTSDQRT